MYTSVNIIIYVSIKKKTCQTSSTAAVFIATHSSHILFGAGDSTFNTPGVDFTGHPVWAEWVKYELFIYVGLSFMASNSFLSKLPEG